VARVAAETEAPAAPREEDTLMATGTFANHPRLKKALPPLVKAQRALAAKIAVDPQDVKAEKAVRAQIDDLLVAAGFQHGDSVTCNGYDVAHHKRAGEDWVNPEKVTAELRAAGLPDDVIAELITATTDTTADALYATVTPSKGAKVRV
jgi:hypothetical protein